MVAPSDRALMARLAEEAGVALQELELLQVTASLSLDWCVGAHPGQEAGAGQSLHQ